MIKNKIILFSAVIALGFVQCTSTETASSSREQEPNQNSQREQGERPQQGERPNVDELFTKMDVNKDGKLSADEVQGPLKDDFSKIDTDGDGFLSKEEVEAAPKPSRGERPQR